MHYVGMHGLSGDFAMTHDTADGRAVGRDRDRRGLWRPARVPGAAGRRAAGAERGRVRRRGIRHALHGDGRHASGSAVGRDASPHRRTGGIVADAVAGGGVAVLRDRRGLFAVAGAGSAQRRRRDAADAAMAPGERSRGEIPPADAGAAPTSPRLRPTPLGGIGQPPRAAPAPRLPVEGADGTHFIDSADVRSVRADAHYTKVHDGTRERMCPWSISEAEAQLDPGLFVRVHRSHIVAIPHVTLRAQGRRRRDRRTRRPVAAPGSGQPRQDRRGQGAAGVGRAARVGRRHTLSPSCLRRDPRRIQRRRADSTDRRQKSWHAPFETSSAALR